MNKLSFKAKEPSAGSRAMAGAVIGVAYAVIGVVVLFFDVMTIKLLFTRFPDGVFRYSAVAGILATGVTIIFLVIGKSHWFRPGGQLNWAWLMTFVELAVSVLNVIASFNPDGMAWWVFIMPATPVLAVVTWILMVFFSPDRAQLHAEMEMQDQQHKAELDYRKAAHKAHMEVMYNQLEMFTGFLQEFTNSPENMENSRKAAERMGRQSLGNITEMPIASPGSSFIFQQQQPPALPVTQSLSQQSPVSELRALPAIDNPQKMLDLLEMAVQYGQMTEEEARPLRQALKASAISQSKNGKN